VSDGVYTTFDLSDHQRRRIRHLEQEVAAFEKREQQLYRIFAAVLVVMFEDTGVDPFEYLNRLVEVDNLKQELGLNFL
jgi:hypothetical protein